MRSGPEKNESWAGIKDRRHKQLDEDRPLLLLYPIDKNSEPIVRRVSSDGTKIDSKRKPLAASEHVMGMGILFPKAGDETDASHYVEVELPTLEDAYDEPEEEQEVAEL